MKRKFSSEWMVARIEEYLSGQGSLRGIAEANGIGYSTFYGWVKKYQEHGASAIVEKNGCSSYSKEFKVRCVEAVIGGEGSVNDIVAVQIGKAALERKRVMAKEVDTTNEKYIFRIWLLSLGMGGDEFKTARRVLLAPLSGNAAFKDAAMEQRWKEKRAAERLVADEQEAADEQEVV